MSNIYINEPPTTGKVLLKTTVGDIDVELWCKETPKACRNFIQLCLEGYYDNTIFHRIVKGFIAQGGDPTGTGLGGESIYDGPFKDEFHSRLRFERRGLVAMANAGKDDNLSQFFFTMAAAPELQNKHTIFGKVTGNTVFNMLKLQEAIVDKNERPAYPQKIISTEILRNPFDDIIPREKRLKSQKIVEKKEVSQSRATKDFKLLSFGDEAEEEEEEINFVIKKDFKSKPKSSHDLIKDDPKLSSDVAKLDIGKTNLKSLKRKKQTREEDDEDLNTPTCSGQIKKPHSSYKDLSEEESEEEDQYKNEKIKMEKAQQELKKIKKEMLGKIRDKEKIEKKEMTEQENDEDADYKKLKNFVNKKPETREEEALEMLKRFKEKLKKAKDKKVQEKTKNDWLAHHLKSEADEEVQAKDANLKNDADWYDIYDPRNPINKLRRDASKGEKKIKKSHN